MSNFELKAHKNGFSATPKRTLSEQTFEVLVNILSLGYHVFLSIVHSYAWYVLFLQKLFMLSSPFYIFLPVALATVFYYALRYYTEAEFSYKNYTKLKSIGPAIKQQVKDTFNYNHLTILFSLIAFSFGATFLLYCITNSLTPEPADMLLYLANPMLATLAGIAAIALIYLAFKPLIYREQVEKEEAPAVRIHRLKTAFYVITAILFYTSCGIGFGAIVNFFFSPILHHNFYQLSSLASWMITMGGCASFFSLNLLSNLGDDAFKQQAARFCDAIPKSRLLTTSYKIISSAIFSSILAVIVFSIMFAPMIHIVPNIWPHTFALLSQTAFYRALAEVIYTSSAVSTVFSLLSSAFTLEVKNPETPEQMFHNFYKAEYPNMVKTDSSGKESEKAPLMTR